MASITSSGIGSGLDVQGIISSLMSIERAPINALTAKEKEFNARISALGQLKNLLSNLKTAANKFSFGQTLKASSNNTDVFEASASIGAQMGDYAVKVTKLAEAQKLATSASGWVANDADATVFQAGQLIIQRGDFNSNGIDDPALRNGSNWAFNLGENPQGNPSTFTIDFAGGTLQDLRSAINNATDADGNAIGLSAQIINGADGAQLVITGKDKGSSNAFSIAGSLDVSTDGGNNFSNFDFSYDIRQATQSSNMREISIPWSTEAEIDGIRITSSSTQISGAIPGVTLNLKSLSLQDSGGQAIAQRLTLTQDIETLKANTEALVSAYNALRSSIRTQTSYDAANSKAGTLNGDATARNIATDIRNAFSKSQTSATGQFTQAYTIGLNFDRNGTLSLDSAKFEAALSQDPSAAQNLLKGLATELTTVANRNLDANGALQLRTDSLSQIIKGFGDRKAALENRMLIIQQRYVRQFTSLDSLVAGMQSTGNFLAQQIMQYSSK